MSQEHSNTRHWHKWLKRYLLLAGVALIGMPLWELLIEDWMFKEIDLLFPGQSDVVIGVLHILILAGFHFATRGIRE